MNFSKLDKRIKFISTIGENGVDEDGYKIEGTKVIRECWASVRGLRGREFYNAASIQAQEDKIFNCRYFEGITTKMNILYNNRKFNIYSINDLEEKHIEYEIHAKEVRKSG